MREREQTWIEVGENKEGIYMAPLNWWEGILAPMFGKTYKKYGMTIKSFNGKAYLATAESYTMEEKS